METTDEDFKEKIQGRRRLKRGLERPPMDDRGIILQKRRLNWDLEETTEKFLRKKDCNQGLKETTDR